MYFNEERLPIEQYSSGFNMHINIVETLIRCRFQFHRSWMEPEVLPITCSLDDTDAAGPQTTLRSRATQFAGTSAEWKCESFVQN